MPPGHKSLTRAVKPGEPLRKYNQIIGFATEDMTPGTHIHTHNCVLGEFERDYAFCTDARPTDRPGRSGHALDCQMTGLMRQMCSAYSRMLRSLENVPMFRELSTALRLHSSGCR